MPLIVCMVSSLCSVVFCLLVSGCSTSRRPGSIYTNIVIPHSRDFDRTPVVNRSLVIRSHKLKEPVSGYGVSVEWTEDELARLARNAGITNLLYSEQRLFSIFMGLYSRKEIIVYGR